MEWRRRLSHWQPPRLIKARMEKKNSHTEWHKYCSVEGTRRRSWELPEEGADGLYRRPHPQKGIWRQEGQKKFIYEILGDVLQMLGGGTRREDSGAPVSGDAKEDSLCRQPLKMICRFKLWSCEVVKLVGQWKDTHHFTISLLTVFPKWNT